MALFIKNYCSENSFQVLYILNLQHEPFTTIAGWKEVV